MYLTILSSNLCPIPNTTIPATTKTTKRRESRRPRNKSSRPARWMFAPKLGSCPERTHICTISGLMVWLVLRLRLFASLRRVPFLFSRARIFVYLLPFVQSQAPVYVIIIQLSTTTKIKQIAKHSENVKNK